MKAVWRISVELSEPSADGEEEINLQVDGEIPFIPVAGMMIAPLANGDFHRVDEVFWHVDEPDRIDIYLKPSEAGLDLLIRQGWKADE